MLVTLCESNLFNSLLGPVNTYYDGQDRQASDGRCYSAGSIVVKPGCTFYTYYGYNYDGKFHEYIGPTVIPFVPISYGWWCGDCSVSL